MTFPFRALASDSFLLKGLRSKQVKGGVKRLRLALPLAAAVALVAMGCGGSFIGGNGTSALVGTWTLDSMTINGSAQTCPASNVINAQTTIACSRYTDTFNNDGTMVRKSADGTVSVNGNFSYNGTVLTTAFGNEDVQAPLSFTSGSNSGSFVVTQNVYGYSVQYTFIRLQ